jgi:hypothetical protein
MTRLLMLLALLCGAACAADVPFVAHNSYGVRDGVDRLDAALSSGLTSVEVDTCWGILRHRAIVTHDHFHLGLTGTELAEYLDRVWVAWDKAAGRREIFLDVKTGTAETARRIHAVLEPHAARLSTLQPGGTFRPGAITVYLTGNPDVQREYEKHARARGTYLAFGEHAFDKGDWKRDARGYVPTSPPGFRRFVNLNVRCLLKKKGAELEPDNLPGDRAAAVAAWCAEAGYPVRVWIVNDTRLWDKLVAAGIPMIATDDYARAVQWWKSRTSRR